MKVLVTGAGGQLGRAVHRVGDRRKLVMVRHRGDITRRVALDHLLSLERPDVAINCAAYTTVDDAEVNRDAAFEVNATGAGNVARVCAGLGIPLLHLSTDYVFDGTAQRPYREEDPVAPVNAYGASKAFGEAEVVAAGGVVVRTSWLFSHDGDSFVSAVTLAAVTRPTLRVVDDQLGCPTYADDLADALVALAERAVRGDALERLYHACNAGPVTWCGFAKEIVALARSHRREIACTEVVAITTAEYPTVARRPAYSVLDTARLRALGIELPPWKSGLETAVHKMFDRFTP